MPYLILKWLHVLFAIVALGANLTYPLWLRLANKEKDATRFALQGIRFLDKRIANPAYALLLLTGFGMLLVSGLPWTTPWVLLSLIVYAVMFLFAILAYSPALKAQSALAEAPGPSSADYRAAEERANRWGVLIVLLVVFIVYLMTVKPALWG